MNPYQSAAWSVPAWADPQKLEQKELRRAASRLSFAVIVSMPIQILLSTLGMLFLMLCGVNFFLPGGNTISGFPATAYYLLTSIDSFLSVVLPFSLFLLLSKRRLSDAILVEKNGALNSVLLVFAGLGLCLLMNIPANLISELLNQAGLNGAINTESFTVGSVADLITMLLSVVLVAPLTEEFAFRGIMVTVMRRWGDWAAVVFSAILFAMAHFSFQVLPTVLMGGFVMALIYVRTRNIWINIFVHLLNNLVATLPIVVDYLFGAEAAELVNVVSFWGVVALSAVSLVILLVRHFAGHPVFKEPMQHGTPVRNKALQLVLNPGFIVYFVCFLVMSVVALYAV